MTTTPQERLRIAREKMGLKQYELAKKLSMLPSSYNQIEIGRNNVSPRVVALLKLMFRVNDKWLLHGEGDMFLPTPENSLEHKGEVSQLRARIKELEHELDRYKKMVDLLILQSTPKERDNDK